MWKNASVFNLCQPFIKKNPQHFSIRVNQKTNLVNESEFTLNKVSIALAGNNPMDDQTQIINNLIEATNDLNTAEKVNALQTNDINQGMEESAHGCRQFTMETVSATQKLAEHTILQGKAAQSAFSLSAAFKNLWAVIKANPVQFMITAVSIGIDIWNKYKEVQEAIRKATLEATQTLQTQTQTIDSYTKQYNELITELNDYNTTNERQYEIKKELFRLQNEINAAYGDEYGKIDLVTNAYQDQTEALKLYSKEFRNTFLNENREGIKNASDQMTKERTYELGSTNGMSFDVAQKVYDIAKKYEDQGISLELPWFYDESNPYRSYTIEFTGDASQAESVIQNFENEVRALEKDFADSPYEGEIIDYILDTSSSSLAANKEVLDNYQQIYKESLAAELFQDDSLSMDFTKALNAVDAYNEAILRSKDPYNDSSVTEALTELKNAQALIQNDSDWDKYRVVTDDIFDQADTRLLDFDNAIKKDTSDLNNMYQRLSNLSDSELEGIINGSITNSDFNDLFENAEDNFDLSYTEFISYIKASAKDQEEINLTPAFGLDNLNKLDISDNISAIQEAYGSLRAAMDEYNESGILSYDTLQSLTSLSDEYVNILFDENGILVDNETAWNELTRIKLEEMKASIYQQAANELCRISQLGAADAANELALANGNITQSAYEAAKAQYENAIAAGAANKELADNIWNSMNARIKLVDEQLANLSNGLGTVKNRYDSTKKSESSYEKQMKDTKQTSKSLTDQLKEQQSALEKVKSRYDDTASAINWFYDQKIAAEQDSVHTLEQQNDRLEQQQSVYDSVLKAVQAVYDKEMESLKAQQDAIQDKIDALTDANDEQERQIALEKAQYALEQARIQRTKYLFNGQEFVYDTDKDAITNARDTLNDAQLSIKTAELEKEKESLQSSIDQLEKYKSMWGEIGNVYETSQNEIFAKMVLGNEYQTMVLQNRLSDISAFKDSYLSVQMQIDDNQSMIDSYNEKIAYYESLKSQWEELTGQYQAQQNIQLLMETFGADYEKILLDGRTLSWDAFAAAYLGVQIDIEEISQKIETAMNNAATTAEAAAARINEAYNKMTTQANGNFYIAKGYKIPPGAALYHSGIKKGRVGDRLLSDQETLNMLYTHATGDPIHSDELLAKLKVGEVVLTKDQQQRTAASLWNYDRFTEMSRSLVLSSFSADSVPSLPSYLTNNANRNMDFTQNIRIELPNVKTGTDANQIINQLSNLSLKANQYFNRR